MYFLGIETSCDETALAILAVDAAGQRKILAEAISSQIKLHELYGGVVPELASREHLRNLPILLDQVLNESKIDLKEITAIGVTRGPGLKGCLFMGYYFAQGLAQSFNIPILGINHIEGHLLAPMLDNPELDFPYLCLIVSGGHTEIHEVKGVGGYNLLARTQDDAAGEAFDKSANLLGLSYPGGAKLAALGDSVTSSPYKLPKVMRGQPGFSFSGLKTAISLLVKKEAAKEGDKLSKESSKALLAYAIQDSIVETLIYKVKESLQECRISKVAVSGGVAANKRLREQMQKIKNVKSYFPTPLHSTDNGAMIAYVTYLRYIQDERLNFNEIVLPRWPVETVNR